jgi:hypothetical protein
MRIWIEILINKKDTVHRKKVTGFIQEQEHPGRMPVPLFQGGTAVAGALELTYSSTRISFKLMRGGKGQGGKAKLTATENKQPEINGLDQRAQRITT